MNLFIFLDRFLNLKCSQVPLTRSICCFVHIISQSKYDTIEVDFGNETTITLNPSRNIVSYFGLPVNPLLGTSNPIYGQSYILTNTEILFDGYLVGYEAYVADAGSIVLKVKFFQNFYHRILYQ